MSIQNKNNISFITGYNRVIVTTWIQGTTYDLNRFQLLTLDPTYNASIYSILCEKGNASLSL